jgi:poly(3-hydroxyalkanoate) synthetase
MQVSMLPSHARPAGAALVDDGLAAWTAAVNGLTDYWSSAMRRGATPWTVANDVLRWVSTTSNRSRPTWTLPNEVVFDAGIARLRDFSQSSTDPVVPTLVLPPQAGHDSCIVDYSAEQSQVREIRDAGLTRVFSLDWLGATPQTKDALVEDYIAVIDRAVEHLGGRVNLVGDCQGGWLATIWAAMRPEQVNTLTIGGAPIDFRAGDGAIAKWVDACAPGGSLALYEQLVRSAGGVFKGEHMINGFILIGPQNEIGRQVQLLANIDDPAHVARYQEFEDWFKHTQDIPGAFYLWIVRHLFRDNELIRGELRVGGERVDLRRIDCPLYLLAGTKDHITPPEQVWALDGATSTPRREVHRSLCTAGHLGLFMGREALRDHWRPMMASVAAQSRADGRAHARPRTAAQRRRPRREVVKAA